MTENRTFWATTTVGDLIDRGILQATVGFPFGGHGISGDDVPHVRPFNVSPLGEIDLSEVKQIPLTAAEGRPRLRRGDILFNNTNTKELVGKCALWDREEQYPFSNHMTRLRVLQPEADPAFLSFAILAHWMSGRSQMLARAHVAQASIMGERLREIALPWPPPAQQRAVAQVLCLVQAAGHAHREIAFTATRLKKIAMRALFTRGLRGEAQKETEIGPMPESWEVVEFGTVRQRLQYGTSTHCTYKRTDYPVLRIPNIEPGRVNADDLKFGKLSPAEAQRYRLQVGDLIFIRTNGVIERLGACAVFAGQPEGALFASYLIRAVVDRTRLDPYFAAQFFTSEIGTSIVTGRATPAADGKYNLNTGTIDSLPLPLPPTLDEQREIVAVLDAIDRKIALHQRKRAVLEDLFKALLHKLMTGEVRVQGLDLSALASATREVAA